MKYQKISYFLVNLLTLLTCTKAWPGFQIPCKIPDCRLGLKPKHHKTSINILVHWHPNMRLDSARSNALSNSEYVGTGDPCEALIAGAQSFGAAYGPRGNPQNSVGTWQTLLGSLQDDTAFGILRQEKFFHLPSLSTCMDCHFRGFMMFDVGVFI